MWICKGKGDLVKPVFRFSLVCMFICFQRKPLRFYFYSSADCDKYRVAVIKRLPVLFRNVDDIAFIYFGIVEPILLTFDNQISLKLMLGAERAGCGVGWYATCKQHSYL